MQHSVGSALRQGRVAVIRSDFLPYTETFIHDQLRMHVRYAPEVFCRKRRNADQFSGYPVNAVEELPGRRRPLRASLYRATQRSPHLDRLFAAGGFDLIHAHFFKNALYGMRWSRVHHTPLVVTLHGADVALLTGLARLSPQRLPVWLSRGRIFRDTQMFLAVSNELRDLIVELGCPPGKVVVHRLGVDVDRFSPDMDLRPTERPEVLMVGRFVEKKGHEDGFRAAALARDAGLDFRLKILGAGRLRARYESLVRSLGLEDRVVFGGTVRHDQMAQALCGASLLMAPSVVATNQDREGAPQTLKEAAACGVPVVGTWHGGIPDIIEDEVTGFLVPERNVEALGQRLIQLLRSPDLGEQLGRAAREKMEREYDLRTRSSALEELYDAALAAGQPC